MNFLNYLRMAIARLIYPTYEIMPSTYPLSMGDCKHAGKVAPSHAEVSNKKEYLLYDRGKRIGTAVVARVVFYDYCDDCGARFIKYSVREPIAYYTGVAIKGD